MHIRGGHAVGLWRSLYLPSTSVNGREGRERKRVLQTGNQNKKEAASSNNLRDPRGNAPWPFPLFK